MNTMDQEKFCTKRKKQSFPSREELLQLSKEELVDRLLRSEAHNIQLKNIITKSHGAETNITERTSAKPFDFSKCYSRRILLRVMYLGWEYKGLATQEDTARTVEHELFSALTRSRLVERRETAGYHRCGRTDKGVSSFGQVISLSIRSKYPPSEQNVTSNLENELQYCKILNRLLPSDIRALCWQPIPLDRPDFSARFDCTQRSYRYYFPRGGLDLVAMATACRSVIGQHDFRNLCKMDVANGVTQFVRNVTACEIVPCERDSTDPTTMYCLRISGNAFLWHQIRCVAGVLLLIGQGREAATVLAELLDVERNPRKPQYSMASDLPLNLFRCEYGLAGWRWDAEELARVVRGLQAEWTRHAIRSTMIKDCLNELERQYKTLHATKKGIDNEDEVIEETDSTIDKDGDTDDSSIDKADSDIKSHPECLLEGVKSRVYKPLMQREKCSSLEERIEHYTKKRRIEPVSIGNNESS